MSTDFLPIVAHFRNNRESKRDFVFHSPVTSVPGIRFVAACCLRSAACPSSYPNRQAPYLTARVMAEEAREPRVESSLETPACSPNQEFPFMSDTPITSLLATLSDDLAN